MKLLAAFVLALYSVLPAQERQGCTTYGTGLNTAQILCPFEVRIGRLVPLQVFYNIEEEPATGFCFFGLRNDFVQTPIGTILIEPLGILGVGYGLGICSIGIDVPNDPGLVSNIFFLQWVVFGQFAPFYLSNGGVYDVRR